MRPASALKLRSWMRRRRASIAALVTLAVLFSTAPVFAAAMSSAGPGSHAMMSAHAHHNDMNMPCCDTGNGADCACMAHCAPLFLSQAMPVLHTMNNSPHQVMAQQMPVPYVDAPPLRPPRA